MFRIFLLAGIPFTSALAGALVAITVALPGLVQAQANQLSADEVWVGPDGQARTHIGRLANANMAADGTGLQVIAADGTVRHSLNIGGGEATPNQAAGGLNINAADGTLMARVGAGTPCCAPVVRLFDKQGKVRLELLVDESGNPAMRPMTRCQ